MSKPTVYYNRLSPPSRSVLLVAKEIGLDIDAIELDFFKGEHRAPDFIKKNPCGTLPTLEENGQIIWDSHAINKYLVRKYAKNDNLYPNDLLLQARIDQRMFFDASYLFPRGFQIMVPVIFMGSSKFTDEQKDQILMGYTLLEQFLEGGAYLVGDKMTLADLTCSPLMESIRRILPIDGEKFPKLCAWLKRLADELPYYQELCVAGAEYHADLFNKALERNKTSTSVL